MTNILKWSFRSFRIRKYTKKRFFNVSSTRCL